MKKTIAIAAALCLLLTGCGGKTDSKPAVMEETSAAPQKPDISASYKERRKTSGFSFLDQYEAMSVDPTDSLYHPYAYTAEMFVSGWMRKSAETVAKTYDTALIYYITTGTMIADTTVQSMLEMEMQGQEDRSALASHIKVTKMVDMSKAAPVYNAFLQSEKYFPDDSCKPAEHFLIETVIWVEISVTVNGESQPMTFAVLGVTMPDSDGKTKSELRADIALTQIVDLAQQGKWERGNDDDGLDDFVFGEGGQAL